MQQPLRSTAIALATLLFLPYLVSINVVAADADRLSAPSTDRAPQYGALPALFVENREYPDMPVRFLSRGGGIPMFFTDRDVRLVLSRDGVRTAVSVELVGAHASRIEGANPTGATVSLLRARAKAIHLPSYREVVYRNAWPGIDALFRDDNGKLSYEFLLSPGARVEDIRLRFGGVANVSLNPTGDLTIHTPAGELTDAAPHTYQDGERHRRTVASRFVIHSRDEVGFAVGEYDRTRPLIIDPSIVYSTYLGGSGVEPAGCCQWFGVEIDVDAQGAAYVTGFTSSPNFPVTPGVLDATLGGPSDAFVAKINTQGNAFEYVTYIGGSQADEGHGIAVDGSGNAFITGLTNSNDFPTTAGAFRQTRGTATDTFVAKLNAQGTALLYSTFLGSNAATVGDAIAVDAAGAAHVFGQTLATNLPTTAGAIGAADLNPSSTDAFLLKFNSSGSAVTYGTYIGGSGSDDGESLDLDLAGQTYLIGTTDSSNLQTTTGAHRRTLSGESDAFVMRINTAASTAASALIYGTYLGGPTHDHGTGIAVDTQSQAAHLAVMTDHIQTQFPPGGTAGPVVAKLNATGSTLEYAREVGPSDTARTNIYDIALAPDGYAYATGIFSEEVGMAWIYRIDREGRDAGRMFLDSDAFITDSGDAIAVDSAGSVYVVGRTGGAGFPVTANAPQRQFQGGELDAFITKISFADMGSVDVAEDKPAQASSLEGPQYGAANAFDGDLSTRWSSQFSDPQSITVDLGQRHHVDRVVLHWETAYGSDYELHISDDGANWYPLRPRFGNQEIYFDAVVAMDGGIDNHINLDGTGRYVRVFGLRRGTQWGYSLWEMEVYGKPVSTPAPAPGSVNVALGGRARASSFESLDLLDYQAVDGSMQTRWSSEFADPQWLSVDLGARVNISRVVLRWETAFGRDYQVQVSNDSQTWETIRTVTDGDGGVDEFTGLNAVGRYVRMYGTRRGTQWGYSLWEFEVYGVIGGGSPPPPPPTSEIVLYADDVATLHNLSLVNDATAAGGKKISSVDVGWSSTEQPPAPNIAPYAIFAINVRERGTYRLWMRMRGQGDSKFNESVWVQYRTTTGASPYPYGTNHGLLVNLENCSGCGIQGWGWQDNSWWLNQPSAVFLEMGIHYLYVTLREDGVEFDQIVLSKANYLHTAPGPVKNDATIVPQPPHDVAESDQGTLVIDGTRGEMNVTGPDGFSLRAAFSTGIGNTVGGIWGCGPDCNPGEETSLFGRWLGGDFTGDATWRGTTYTNLGSQASNSSAELVLGGSVKLPPASASDQIITVPFAAAGQMQLANGTTHHLHHRGGGTVTLTLHYSAATNSWTVTRADFTFAP